MVELSDSQKGTLYRVANAAMLGIVHGHKGDDMAWKDAFGQACNHKATIKAFIGKGLVGSQYLKLTAEGIQVAKEIWASDNADTSWDAQVSLSIKERDKDRSERKQAQDEWRDFLESLPVPEGYQAAEGRSPFNLEWRTEEFAYAPTISICDPNAPFMKGARYKKPEWQMSFSTGSQMDAQAVRIFKQALDIAHIVMSTLEVRYADEEVQEV